MFLKHNAEIFNILKKSSFGLTDDFSLVEEALGDNISVIDCIINNSLLNEERLWRILGEELSLQFEEDPFYECTPEEVEHVLPFLDDKRAIPLRISKTKLDLLVCNPFDLDYIDSLGFLLRKKINIHLVTPTDFKKLSYHFNTSVLMESVKNEEFDVIDFVNTVLSRAIKEYATDIHFEHYDGKFLIRFRIDGLLVNKYNISTRKGALVVSRLKIMANLDINKKRVAQDGRFSAYIDYKQADFRISVLPTQLTQSIVIRILNASCSNLSFPKLGFGASLSDSLLNVAKRASGMFLIVGPTGSGKTTTVNTILKELNKEDVKILTVEDPIEYEQEGIIQMPIKSHQPDSFSSALKAFLRHDPDKMMIGEIRDLETAKIAIQASLTGHMIFSTLHTNNTVSTISRLIDIGVEPFLLATALSGVLAQRLLRRICEHCKEDVTIDRKKYSHLNEAFLGKLGKIAFEGVGCPHCNFTGYNGRVLIAEFLEINDDFRGLIGCDFDGKLFSEKMKSNKIKTLKENAIDVFHKGLTTIQEITPYLVNS